MGLKVAIQMDPIGGINIAADSTFRIMEEAQARGHTLFYYTPDKLSFRMGRILARGWPVTGGSSASSCAGAVTAAMPRIRPPTIRSSISKTWANCSPRPS